MPFVPDEPSGRFVPDEPIAPQEQKPYSFMEVIKPFLGQAIPGGGGLKLLEALNKGAYDIGGKVTDVASNLGASPEVAAGAGVVAKTGIESFPVAAGGIVGSRIAGKMEQTAKNLMASALKPTPTQWESGEAKKAIDTLLKEGVSPTEGGVEILKEKISALNDKIKQAVASSTENVTVGETGKPLLDVLNSFGKQVAAQTDLNAIRNVWNMYRNHPLFKGADEIPVQLAQQLKQGTYRQLEGKYGEMTSAEVEAQKAIARGLKDEIVAKIPALKNLNAKESELLNALNVAERRALLDLAQNPGGLVYLIHNPKSAAIYLASHSSPFKAMVARMIYNTPGAAPVAAGATAGATADLVNQQR